MGIAGSYLTICRFTKFSFRDYLARGHAKTAASGSLLQSINCPLLLLNSRNAFVMFSETVDSAGSLIIYGTAGSNQIMNKHCQFL
jgi:hypothetical protein